MRRSFIAAGGGLALLVMAAVAWTQTRPTDNAPAEIVLTPSRADQAALAQARQDPLAERLRGVMRQYPEAATVLARAAALDVPVLAPADPELLRVARLYPGDRHYMLVMERGAQVIEIYGATKAFVPAGGPTASQAPAQSAAQAAPPPVAQAQTAPRARVGDWRTDRALVALVRRAAPPGLTDLRVEQTEYGTDVAFSRFGAAYNVSFICEGQGAPGCTAAEAVTFALSLQLIGGGGS